MDGQTRPLPDRHSGHLREVQNIMTTPSFSLITRQQVLGTLKATRSTDADVLATAKEELIQPNKFLKFMGIWAYVTGGLATILILTAIIGIPLLIFGWW